jgi:hypothetical protein
MKVKKRVENLNKPTDRKTKIKIKIKNHRGLGCVGPLEIGKQGVMKTAANEPLHRFFSFLKNLKNW